MSLEVLHGDALEVLRTLPDGSVRCCVTSPPYWGLRDYGIEGQIGLEKTPEQYVSRLVEVFREVRRVLADDGTLWLNLGDSYTSVGSGGDTKSGFNSRYFGSEKIPDKQGDKRGLVKRDLNHGLKPKDLVGIPWRVAFALQRDGWYLRSDIIWSKPNPMPESVTDRPTKAHEYLFLLSKAARYFYDLEAIREPPKPENQGWMRAPKCGPDRPGYKSLANDSGNVNVKQYDEIKGANRRSVWTVTTEPFPEAHFAVMPQALVEPCILAGSEPKDLVLDPFAGSGTVGVVALRHGRRFVGVELNPEYVEMSRRRIAGPLFAEV